ncbi:MAG: Glycine cleavage system H protein [Alphaproteobacteria bacterium MarineAlpha2_Bin1]|nr:MAG: Glycine cleavage system H protein [Alphaproteobacteria bacterium MarineAlpha2_Bin1]|tara:strand:+ start:423 stop:797 length:375 start_codon:yes stop_codon:yes gene_type:complete
MKEIKYTKDHEWIKIDDEYAYVGITDFAQKQLGDVVFIQLPEIGTDCTIGEEVAVIESVKAASEIYAPISGQVLEVNESLNDSPDIINSDAENNGWIWKMSVKDSGQISDLMDKSAYSNFIIED